MKLPIDEIKPNPNNPRVIMDDKFKKLVQSIKDFPEMTEVREVVVNKDHMILGGNMRFKAMKEAGWKEVPVRVVDWPEDKQREFVIKDNVAGGDWDWDVLANEWDADLLDGWGLDLPAQFGVEEVEEDEAPEVSSEPPVSQLGVVYQLGKHRVACMDSTDFGALSDLMDGKEADMIFTDPPYGVAIGEKNQFLNSFQPSGRNLEPIKNDSKLKPGELYEILKSAFTNAKEVSKDGMSFYVTAPQGGDLGLMMMMMMMSDSGLPARHVLIWKKNSPTFSMGRLDYEYEHEPILYGWKKTHQFYGNGTRRSVWEIDKPRSSKEHPTMKPIELIANALKNSSKEGDIILDIFGGSGSTLIASEQLGRVCYMSELAPEYVDVIRKRYAKYVSPENWEDNWQELTPVLSEN